MQRSALYDAWASGASASLSAWAAFEGYTFLAVCMGVLSLSGLLLAIRLSRYQ